MAAAAGRRAARRDSGVRRFCWWWSETVGRMPLWLPSAGLPRISVSLLLATGGRRGWLLVSAQLCSAEVAVRRGVAVLALARGAAVHSSFCLLAVRAWAARLSDSAWPDPVGSGGGQVGSCRIWPAVDRIWSRAAAGCSDPCSVVVQGAVLRDQFDAYWRWCAHLGESPCSCRSRRRRRLRAPLTSLEAALSW